MNREYRDFGEHTTEAPQSSEAQGNHLAALWRPLWEIVGSNTARASILGQFIYWAQRRGRARAADQRAYFEEERARLAGQGESREHGYIFKSASQIKDEAMLDCSERTVNRHLDALVKLGFLDRRRNPQRGYDRTFQYRPNLVAIFGALALHGYDPAAADIGLKPAYSLIRHSDGWMRQGDGWKRQGGAAIPENTQRDTQEITRGISPSTGLAGSYSFPIPQGDTSPDTGAVGVGDAVSTSMPLKGAIGEAGNTPSSDTQSDEGIRGLQAAQPEEGGLAGLSGNARRVFAVVRQASETMGIDQDALGEALRPSGGPQDVSVALEELRASGLVRCDWGLWETVGPDNAPQPVAVPEASSSRRALDLADPVPGKVGADDEDDGSGEWYDYRPAATVELGAIDLDDLPF